MKHSKIIVTLIVIILLFLAIYFFAGYSYVPSIPQTNTDDAINDIVNSFESGDYTPTDIQVQTTAAGGGTSNTTTTVKNVPMPKAAVPSYSPFDRSMYQAHQDSTNLLTTDQVNSFISTLHMKLGMYTKVLAVFWNVQKTLDSLTAFFSYQVQVSQLSDAYFNSFGVEMITDIKNTLSDSDKGRYFISQIVSSANSLPLGY